MSAQHEISSLTAEEKRTLLAGLLDASADVTSNLTLEQRRLWLLIQLDEKRPWQTGTAVRLTGRTDPAVLQQALSAAVQRHEVLRTTFRTVDGRPLATVRPVASLRLPVVQVDPARLDAELARISASETRRRFDLAQGPLVRASLLRLGEEDHVLLLTVHQLVADRRSVRLFTDEVLSGYGQLLGEGGQAASPAAEPEALGAAQRAWLTGDEAEKDIEFWRARTTGLAGLELPTDRPRPPVKTIEADVVSVPVPARLRAALEEFASGTGRPLSQLLLAGYATVLARHAQQQTFAVGVPVPPSWQDGAEELVGPLENTLPVRFDLEPAESLNGLLRRTGSALDEALEHARLPFEQIVEAARPVRDLSRTPLFQVLFGFEEEWSSRELPGAVARPLSLPVTWTPHDIDLYAVRRDGELSLRAHHNTALFDRETVERLLHRMLLLLESGLAEPDRPLSDLSLLSAPDRERLSAWNATATAHTGSRLLHELVGRAAAATPDAVALTSSSAELTYASMDARAESLAARLAGLGAGPESLVGVLADRSVHTMVALLGVLKSGAAYVPLDPSYPADRIASIAADAGIRVLVGSRGTLDGLDGTAPGLERVVVPTADPDGPVERPAVPVAPDSLAYVIYTSGSTGRPKGVAVEHRQITHSTLARSVVEGPGLPERYLVLAPFTFDASGGGLYWTLRRGGTVVVPTEAEVLDPRLLGELIRAKEVTHVDGVPSQYAVLLESETKAFPSVRATVLAGEVLPPGLVEAHRRRSPGVALFNEYGPTEATVWASVHPVTAEDAGAGRVPIGRPIPNTRLHLLDRRLNPVPPGVPGELYIGGEGVVRGYVNRPGMTAGSFLPDPFGEEPGGRLYRTGDLARYRADGSVEFLGRADTQVKIRGFRIELTEIENVLLRHPLVAETAVIAREDQPGVPRLVAYVVPAVGRVLTRETLNKHVLAQVPDYMVPSAFVTLERMPLTPNGKIDTGSLPAPDLAVEDFVEPGTQLEAEIAETFCSLLGVSKVSAVADFFELGGNSLLVARLTAQLSRTHDVALPVEQIFRVPTVAGIAAVIEEDRRQRDNVDSEVLYAQQLKELHAEIRLPEEITPGDLPHSEWFAPRHALVTGATGYLGAFLAVELIQRTDALVHCLVRAEDEETAWERMEQTLRKYHAWDEAYRPRMRMLVGDLAKPRFGLSEAEFTAVAAEIDVVYHSGAVVNFTYPYEAARPANVEGTKEVLRLATTRTLKSVHFVSSVDVFMGTGAERPFTEQDLDSGPNRIPTGYPRSKWLAEKIVYLARDRGIPVTVQRPWMITGHTRTGASHHTDYLYVYLRGFLDLGVLPLYDDVINAVPVDFTAQAIVHTSLREENFGKNFNITNPAPTTMTQCYQWLRSFGYDLNVIDEEDARQRALGVDEDHVLFPMTPLLRVASMRHAALDPELQKQIDPQDECRVLTEALEGSGIACPPVAEEWAHACFRFLVDGGYLPAPEDVVVPQNSAH
ncbi:aminoadipate-semialdehyde dehydrogenase large subunit [Streptomyces zinciresistens K42]|uniref:Aminoadipate-semialdehyde dehydrogenase large subunit n=1 Tax=Streptomyces zinciresistens K42 TaxID=700597 RepID=G2GKM1_9ACTN|nr:non-ribosomal peptide synthetase [Streptomyces zinciresistens]EGX55941.1 aminoadipate-semialdehyde dehydrogenase large subunit [Streptomyces zinciresistens K42]